MADHFNRVILGIMYLLLVSLAIMLGVAVVMMVAIHPRESIALTVLVMGAVLLIYGLGYVVDEYGDRLPRWLPR